MDIQEAWEKALKYTEIHKARVQRLSTFADTQVPYILLSESTINVGDTVVRRGEVVIERPAIILPPNIPQFQGFEFEREATFNKEAVINFLFVRGVTLPSLKYNNKTYSLNIHEEGLGGAIEHFSDELQRTEDVHTGLIAGPEDCWQFSILIFICSQITRDANHDIKKLLDEYKKHNP